MKVLMLGWEFPPHISGGLGTACYGIAKGLKKYSDVELIFVVPKLFGDEDFGIAKLIGANDILVDLQKTKKIKVEQKYSLDNISEEIQSNQTTELLTPEVYFKTKIEINSLLSPYITPSNFENYIKSLGIDINKVRISKEGKIFYIEDGNLKELIINDYDEMSYSEEGYYQFTGIYGPNLLNEVKYYAKIVAKIARKLEFDVIHAHDWLTYMAGIEAKKATGKKLVVHVHATEFDRSGENVNQLVYDIERMGMDNADKIVAVSNLTKKIVVERYGQDENKVETVYNAVDFAEKQKKFRKTVDDKIVTFLGRITYQKGPEYFVQAAKMVYDRVPNVRFVMAGSGDMLHRMISYAAKLKISDRFHFTDFLKGDDVKRMFDISDVYVMPSVSEPFGIAPLEAMSSNVPVIISKQSGVAEILKHAIKVDFWDTHAIADAIYGLVQYDGLSTMFRKYGKIEVDNLKWENSATRLRDIYISLI